MLKKYFKSLYERTMKEAYDLAHDKMSKSLGNSNATCLDCGAHKGYKYETLHDMAGLSKANYYGMALNGTKSLPLRRKKRDLMYYRAT